MMYDRSMRQRDTPTEAEAAAAAVRVAVREALKSPNYSHDQVAAIAYQTTLAMFNQFIAWLEDEEATT